LPLKAQGEFALVKQNLEHALGTAGQPVNFGTMAHDHELYMILTDTAAELRDADALRSYVPHLERVAGRDGHRLYLAIAYRALGIGHRLAGQRDAAETRLGEALALFSGLGAHWQMGRTQFELGELHRTHAPARAREYYLQALDSFEKLQAAPDMERARVALSSLG
jgi:tetratricopeptide (TPR) repeat protein